MITTKTKLYVPERPSNFYNTDKYVKEWRKHNIFGGLITLAEFNTENPCEYNNEKNGSYYASKLCRILTEVGRNPISFS